MLYTSSFSFLLLLCGWYGTIARRPREDKTAAQSHAAVVCGLRCSAAAGEGGREGKRDKAKGGGAPSGCAFGPLAKGCKGMVWGRRYQAGGTETKWGKRQSEQQKGGG